MAKSAEANRELQMGHLPAVVYVPERAFSAEKTEKKLSQSREWRQPSSMTKGSREKKVLGWTGQREERTRRVTVYDACLLTD